MDVEIAEMTLGPGLPTIRIGSGPRPLVYLPGLSVHPGLPTGMERRMATSGWEPLLGDYSVYRIGRRVRPVGTTFADMAEDTIAAVESLGPPVDLMGGSTGGMLALHVAAARPDLIRRLVVVITGPMLSDEGRRMCRRVTSAIRAGRWRRAFSTVMPIGAASAPRRSAYLVIGWLLGPRFVGIPSDPTLLVAELEAWMRVDATALLADVTSPTLVIGGAKDPVFPPGIVEPMARALPNASLVIMPGVAHDFPSRLMSDEIRPFLLAPDA
jgi:pimeloyl-ACP methyl ester carboxylesterase